MYIVLLISLPFLEKHTDDSIKKIKNIEIIQPAHIIKDSSVSPTHSMEKGNKRLAKGEYPSAFAGKLTAGTILSLHIMLHAIWSVFDIR